MRPQLICLIGEAFGDSSSSDEVCGAVVNQDINMDRKCRGKMKYFI